MEEIAILNGEEYIPVIDKKYRWSNWARKDWIGKPKECLKEFVDDVEEEFIKLTNISAIVGKGGMKKELLKTFEEYKVVYLAAPGGCAALLANSVKKVNNVYFLEELGMPEAVWELEVGSFGPLIVAMDSHGNSIYEEVNKKVHEKLNELIKL